MPQQQPNVSLSYSVFTLSFMFLCGFVVFCVWNPFQWAPFWLVEKFFNFFFLFFLFLIGSVVFCMMLSSFFFLCRFYRETSVVMLLSNSFISCGQRDNDDLTVRVFLFLFSVSFLLLIHQIYSEKYQFSFNMVSELPVS